jgi:GT2 family glycosyltransferase
MPLPSVAVVVLNWHGRADTLCCLHSLAALSYPRFSMWLVDNGCREFSAEEVARLVPGGSYLHSDTNLGFAGGCNLGIREALRTGTDFVLLLNNDATIAPEALTWMVQAAEADSAVGIVGAKVLRMAEPSVLECAALHVNLRWGRLYQIGFGEPDRGQYDHLVDVTAVSGTAMLLRRALCERLGGFDERYFVYLEDVDLCLRARQAGFRVNLASHARVWHKGKASTGGATSPSSLYYATRNHLTLMAEHAHRTGAARLLGATIAVLLNATYALRTGVGSRRKRLLAVWRGIRDYRRGAVGARRSCGAVSDR